MPETPPPSHIRLARLLAAVPLVGFLSIAAAHAQAVQPWPDVLISAPIAKQWLVSGELIGRIADDQRTSQLETRLHLGHVFSRRVTGWIGWVHMENYTPQPPNGREDQLVEQANWNLGAVEGVRLSTRTRLEQRFIARVDGTNWRWRQQVRAVIPLGDATVPSTVLWGEPYVALNRSAAQARTLDQLRLFVGFNVPVSPNFDVELGYLNQRLYRAGPTLVNHAIPIVLTLRL